MKTVIYWDVLLLVNFLIAYFLLLAAGALSGQRADFPRMLAGSALAAVSTLVILLPEQAYPVQIAYKLGTAALITGAAFGWRHRRRFVTAAVWYAALNVLLAGLAMLAALRTGSRAIQTGNLAVYLRVPPLLLLALSGACCGGAELALRLLARPARGVSTVGVEFVLCDTAVHLRAALDTGCRLKDPITCLPVLLVSYPDAAPRLPPPARAFLDAWFAGAKTVEPPPGVQLRLIPCATAAQHGLLPGFAVGSIGLITARGVQGLGRTAVAFAPQPFGGGDYEALYGNDFL